MAGRGVPFHRAAQARIQVRLTCCNQAELQRRAGIRLRRDLAASEKAVECADIAVRATRDDGDAFGRRAATYDVAAALRVFEPRAMPSGTGEQSPERGREHHAEFRAARIDERDVDREFAVALDEFLRAVERIDKPEQRIEGRNAAERRLLFGDHGDLGRQFGKAPEDHRFGPFIGFGDRRRVGLAAHREIGPIDRHRRLAGFTCHGNDALEKLCLVHALTLLCH